MPTYNLIEYSGNYLKTSESLWQYGKDEPTDNLAYSESFKSKAKQKVLLLMVIQKMLK